MDWLKIILASTIVSGLVSAVISAWVSYQLKGLEFRNDYYKKVIEKRLNAYSLLETHISLMKLTVMDSNRNPYPGAFARGIDYLFEVNSTLSRAMGESMWLSGEVEKCIVKLNSLFFQALVKCETANEEEVSIVGKAMYRDFSETRHAMENQIAADLLELHNVKKFLRGKPSKSFYRNFP